ncbi:Uu.00g086370.m01.CDS01 [Anthostomella pinea]|uniref:Uu.00g086370.m01.CDS01 n=1 Tax=Anthostomella pinea TaxID=933095 RepID=A0AAI8VN26_9PEZI|nr:Uu.00g086370.m01.CDS01 [Anthostomella pinea]
MIIPTCKILVLASLLASGTESHIIPFGILHSRDIDYSSSSSLAQQRFGSFRLAGLEEYFKKHNEPFTNFEDLNKKLFKARGKTMGEDYNHDRFEKIPYQEIRDNYYVPKGNYAHLHFNAYLPSIDGGKQAKDWESDLDELEKADDADSESYKPFALDTIYTKLKESGKKPFEATKAFEDSMEAAGKDYGDLVDFTSFSKDQIPLKDRADKTWPQFQALTSKFKGPFEYEWMWRYYLKALFRDWNHHKILHGELRHVFLNDILWNEQGKKLSGLDGSKQMLQVVHDEVEIAKKLYPDFVGAKVIYCIPRMFKLTEDEAKKQKETKPFYQPAWNIQEHDRYIELAKWQAQQNMFVLAAFDIVGREDKDTDASGLTFYNNRHFKAELVRLLKNAPEGTRNLSLHAGEAIDMSPDAAARVNMEMLAELAEEFRDSLMRGGDLVGLEHDSDTSGDQSTADVMKSFESTNVAAELCPVSNEGLGTALTAVDGADRFQTKIMLHLYTSVSGDDPTFFGLEPALELAYMMVGSEAMTLYRLVALAFMSINSSYMTQKEIERAYDITIEQVKAIDF